MRASASHAPTDYVPGPFTPAELETFYRRGFLLSRHLFSPIEVGALRASFERLAGRAPKEDADVGGARYVVSDGAINRVVWCGALEPPLLCAGRDPRLLHRVSQLLASTEVVHLINQAHFKLPGDEVAFEWHQDSERRRYGTEEWTDVDGRGSYVQTALAIDDCFDDNGPLRFIPGNPGHLGLPSMTEEARADWTDESKAEPAIMAAGSVLFFGPYTIHGSEPNRSTRPRRILINGYAAPGANRRHYPGSNLGVHVDVQSCLEH